MTNILKFSKIKNFRDLGSKNTINGMMVMPGRLFRSANPGFASKADIRKLKSFNLDLIIDFRGNDEKKKEEKLFQEQFRYEPQPVKAGNLSPAEYLPVMLRSSAKDMQNLMTELYKSFPEQFQKQFGVLMKSAESNKTILFHCTAGKDRTGFASALLLSALGVDKETIQSDYMLSNIHFAPVAKELAKQLNAEGVSFEVAEPLLTVTPRYIDAAFQVIHQKFGSIENYITDTLNIDIKKLKENYLFKA